MLGGSWNFDLVALHCRPLALHQTVLYVRDHLVNFVEEVSLSQWSILGGLIGRWGSTVEESIKHLEKLVHHCIRAPSIHSWLNRAGCTLQNVVTFWKINLVGYWPVHRRSLDPLIPAFYRLLAGVWVGCPTGCLRWASRIASPNRQTLLDRKLLLTGCCPHSHNHLCLLYRSIRSGLASSSNQSYFLLFSC